MTTKTVPILSGYHMIEEIYETENILIYRAQRESDQQSVVIKLLKSEYPAFNELVQFRNQYAIAKNLDLDGIVKPYGLENYRNGFALVMEDFGGVALDEYIASNPLTLEVFFQIALSIVKILETIYKKRVIHKDLKPQNIMIHPKTQQVKLIDFSIASLLPRESQEIQSPKVLEGTLTYMSPEQTGRMNRGVDYRTDFYSLGVTFYELLTGQLPFFSTDPMELVHCHIAVSPTPPIELNPAIPQRVNDIILKLMAKTAEERYQSAFGLRYDLEICQQQWQQNGNIALFSIGQRDISDRFHIPEKLYGRETEVATLLAAFERVADDSQSKTEMMLVAGFSGIGKTALVNEVHKPIVRQRGYFIKGKYDQFKRNIPFSALVQALQMLMRLLLTESAEQVQVWQTKILKTLGENAQVIIEVIPELEQIIGSQPPALELEATAAQNRFHRLFQKFISVFTTVEHPLVIFLDDLQWIDSASLKLLQLLMSETDTHYLLLIGAYRDNEVSPTHPLMLTLADIQQTNAVVNKITLAPLAQPALNQLIAETLSCPSNRATPLTTLVIQKTQGNPFFTNQFLKFLHDEGLITFDFERGYWQCNIAQVKALALTNDVVEFMANQLQKLPINTQNVLQLAACIGNQFDLTTLAIVHEKSPTETATDLWKALQEGLVVPISEFYKFFQEQESLEIAQVEELSVSYKFLHDRVQQAAYSLIQEQHKPSTHLKIGLQLKSHTPQETLEDNIFDIVNQLNLGRELIQSDSQNFENMEGLTAEKLAQLNLIAGRKARASTAYVAANRYLTVGLELLVLDSWQSQYDLTLALYESAAEAAYLSGDFSRQRTLSEIVMVKANSWLDKITIYEVQIQAYMAQNLQLEAMKIVLPILKQLEIEFPEKPCQKDIELELQATQSAWEGTPIKTLGELQPMTAVNPQVSMRLLSMVLSAAYQVTPELYPLILFKQVQLSIQYGNTPESTNAYASYGLILCGIVGEIEVGYQFGQLALSLLERFNAKELKAKTYLVVFCSVMVWKAHVKNTLKPLLEGYQSGLETGDLEYGPYSAFYYCGHSYFVGKELTELEQELAIYCEDMEQLKQQIPLNVNNIIRQAVLNLMGLSENPSRLIGNAYNESIMLPQHQQAADRNAICNLHIHKLLLSYIFQDYRQAVENANIVEQYLDGVVGTLSVAIFHFYDSLVRLAVYLEATPSEQENILTKVTANQEKMQKWAHHAPMNFQHKFELVAAERYRVLGQALEAMDYYEHAIAGAKDNEYLQEEALANELAGKFYLGLNKEKIAKVYLTDAYYGYARWGAKAKVEDLERCYPQLLVSLKTLETTRIHPSKRITNQETSKTIAATRMTHSDVLDLGTVIKASQAISGEIHLEQLLCILMQVVIENAGAEKGALILNQNGQLVIEALYEKKSLSSKHEEIDQTTVLQCVPIEKSKRVPLTLINYVSRTFETQVINDVTVETTFAADPYIINQQPKSVLCTPILKQNQLIGLLYLENNKIRKAFTSERLEILRMLSSQIAISLENALLYQTLEQKVVERTAQLGKANAQLTQANQKITTLNEELASDNLRMRTELDVSRRLQQMLLPSETELKAIPDLEIDGFLEPAEKVGGDYYDVLQHNGYVKIGIGDVTGHGLESGVLALMVQSAVRALLADNETDPVKFLEALNHTIYNNAKRIESRNNMTLILLDYKDGILHVSGQHEYVILVRNGKLEAIDTDELGFPIGLTKDIAKFVSQTSVSLQPGDVVVLYTDGITEAANMENKEYGLSRLCEIVQHNWQRPVKEIRQAIIEDVRQYIGEQKVFDDIALLVVKRKIT